MRPVLQSDVAAAARALMLHAATDRAAVVTELIRQAEAADRYARRLGKWHREWGNGTLLGAARQYPLAPERAWDDPAFLMCLRLVLAGLHAHRQDRNM